MFRETAPGVFERWTEDVEFQLFGDYMRPLGWFAEYTAEQLAEDDLIRDEDIAEALPIPPGYRQTDIHVERIKGVPTFVFDLEKIVEIVEPISEFASAAKARILVNVDSLDESIAADTPKAERAGWVAKAEAARAYLAHPGDSPSVILAAEAEVTGETVERLCEKIIARADRYMRISGQMAGIRRRAGDVIDAAVAAGDRGGVQDALDTALTAISAISQVVTQP